MEIDGRLFAIKNVTARSNTETGENHFSPETVEQLHQILRERARPTRTIRTPVYEFV